MPDSQDELKPFYMPYHNQKQMVTPISRNVYYLGHFQFFGPMQPLRQQWMWKKQGLPADPKPIYRSQDFQEKCLDRALSDLNNCVVLSTTPTYWSQFQNACLLKAKGFQLLEDRCYRHPAYTALSPYAPEHPGIPDCYLHWEHIWWKVIGEPREIGEPVQHNQMNNCGVDSESGLDDIIAHDRGIRGNYLCVGWLARGQLFPKGWKRFFAAKDYKLGVNFDLISRGSKVQTCNHNFDLKILEDWKPDFEKWTPA